MPNTFSEYINTTEIKAERKTEKFTNVQKLSDIILNRQEENKE